MKYYKLIMDDEHSIGNEIVCCAANFAKKEGFNKYILYEGRRISEWDEPLEFSFDEEEGNVPIDYMANDLLWELISPRFKQLLIDIGATDLQFIPVIIKGRKTGVIINGYSVLNITTFTDAISFEHSVFTRETVDSTGEQYYIFIKYALYESALDNKHVVRVKENRYATFVSEKVRREIKKQKLNGCDFMEVKVV